MIRPVVSGAVAAVVLVIAAVSPALAAPIQTAIGNSIVSTYPDGRTAVLWLQADGTYTGKGRKHDDLAGHWTVKGEQLCMRQARPFPTFFSFCAAMPDVGMNVSWRAKAPTGEAITIRVAPGRVEN